MTMGDDINEAPEYWFAKATEQGHPYQLMEKLITKAAYARNWDSEMLAKIKEVVKEVRNSLMTSITQNALRKLEYLKLVMSIRYDKDIDSSNVDWFFGYIPLDVSVEHVSLFTYEGIFEGNGGITSRFYNNYSESDRYIIRDYLNKRQEYGISQYLSAMYQRGNLYFEKGDYRGALIYYLNYRKFFVESVFREYKKLSEWFSVYEDDVNDLFSFSDDIEHDIYRKFLDKEFENGYSWGKKAGIYSYDDVLNRIAYIYFNGLDVKVNYPLAKKISGLLCDRFIYKEKETCEMYKQIVDKGY